MSETSKMYCPRCNSPKTELMTRSKTANWQVYVCQACLYGWRTSEPAPFTHHELYDKRFALTAEQITAFTDFPPIPAGKSSTVTDARLPPRRGVMDI
jgi:hypothetical protein